MLSTGAPPIKTKPKADEIDAKIGAIIRKLREEAGMSQIALSEKIGVSFQQLQKYEKGTNRVAASRLLYIAQALKLPITAFYNI